MGTCFNYIFKSSVKDYYHVYLNTSKQMWKHFKDQKGPTLIKDHRYRLILFSEN